MCECGCASFTADFQLPAPEGKVYLLNLRPPCPECDTPVGVIIERVDPKSEPHRDFMEHVPPLPFVKVNADWVECAIPLIAPRPLREQLVGEVTATEDLDNRDVANALADAMLRTRKRWDEVVAKESKKRKTLSPGRDGATEGK